MEESTLTDFQIAVAQAFFDMEESRQYVVAGGAALLASELIRRPTQDLDLFTHAPVESVTPARDAFLDTVERRGWSVTVIHDSPSFCRLVVSGPDDVLVDLAIDSPPTAPPVLTVLGPTLAPEELAGRKLLALFGRAEARDFTDVYVLAQRFGTQELVTRAAEVDAGFDERVLAQMMAALGRFSDDELPAAPDQVPLIRDFFAEWAQELARR